MRYNITFIVGRKTSKVVSLKEPLLIKDYVDQIVEVLKRFDDIREIFVTDSDTQEIINREVLIKQWKLIQLVVYLGKIMAKTNQEIIEHFTFGKVFPFYHYAIAHLSLREQVSHEKNNKCDNRLRWCDNCQSVWEYDRAERQTVYYELFQQYQA